MPDEIRIATTAERVALARKTHSEVVWTLSIAFGVLAAVIVTVGSLSAAQGNVKLPVVIAVGVALLGFPVVAWFRTRRAVRRADLYLAADGTTQFRVGPDALTVADTVIPFEQITCIYFRVEKAQYSGTERTKPVDHPVGTKIDPVQSEKLYVEGAMSWARMMVGVIDRESIAAPERMINPLNAFPSSGLGSGRINIPFGAYLSRDDFAVFLEALQGPAAAHGFPLGVVDRGVKWSQAQASAAKTPDEIRKEAAAVLETQA